MSAAAIAVQGIGFGPLATASQGFLLPEPPPPASDDLLSAKYLGRPNVRVQWGFPAEPAKPTKPTTAPLPVFDRRTRRRRDGVPIVVAPKPSAPLLRMLARLNDAPIAPRPVPLPDVLPAPVPVADPAELRRALREELDAAADAALLGLTLWAELLTYAHEAALAIDLMAELHAAQRWAEAQIRRRRNAAAVAATLLLLGK
jgi:hypothetical protein